MFSRRWILLTFTPLAGWNIEFEVKKRSILADIQGAQRMEPNIIGKPLTFYLARSQVNIFNYSK